MAGPEAQLLDRAFAASDFKKDLLHVVTFGPGTGEASVVILPDRQVGVVDGCVTPKNEQGLGDPVRALLRSLEDEAKEEHREFRLAFLCLTHPHVDHYRGLTELIKHYAGRIDRLATPLILSSEHSKKWLDWLKMTAARPSAPAPDADLDFKGLQALLDVWGREEAQAKRRNIDGNCRILSSLTISECLVNGCAPSPADVKDGVERLILSLNGMNKNGSSEVSVDANATSGALVVRFGQAAVLLAGDLLKGHSKWSGWENVHHDSDVMNGIQHVQVVNVAHHASKEAHHAALWAKMCPQVATVTPFKHAGGGNPPRPEQIRELLKSSRVIITSTPKWTKAALAGFEIVPKAPVPHTGMRQAGTEDFSAEASVAAPSGVCGGVAVSLDGTGTLQQVLLTGPAREYLPEV